MIRFDRLFDSIIRFDSILPFLDQDRSPTRSSVHTQCSHGRAPPPSVFNIGHDNVCKLFEHPNFFIVALLR